jgi:hypothetical protein
LESDDYNVIGTGHERLWLLPESIDGPALWRDLDKIAEKHPNIKVVRSGDVASLLTQASVLVGDFSSILVEYSLLNRPIVRIRTGHVFNCARTQFVYDRCAITCDDPSRLRNAISIALDDRQEPIAKERATMMREYFLQRCGQAAKTAAAAIVAVMDARTGK